MELAYAASRAATEENVRGGSVFPPSPRSTLVSSSSGRNSSSASNASPATSGDEMSGITDCAIRCAVGSVATGAAFSLSAATIFASASASSPFPTRFPSASTSTPAACASPPGGGGYDSAARDVT